MNKTPMLMLKQFISKIWKANYLLYFAKYILRLGRFHKLSDPYDWFVAFIGGMCAPFVWALMKMSDHDLGLPQNFGEAGWIGVRGAFVCLGFFYVIWEIVQGIKWIHTWSGKYLSQVKDEQQRIEIDLKYGKRHNF